jgi:hypothetical protein
MRIRMMMREMDRLVLLLATLPLGESLMFDLGGCHSKTVGKFQKAQA